MKSKNGTELSCVPNLNMVNVSRWPEAEAGVASGVAGGRHSDRLRLGPGVVLADEHNAHVHSDVTPFERLAYRCLKVAS